MILTTETAKSILSKQLIGYFVEDPVVDVIKNQFFSDLDPLRLALDMYALGRIRGIQQERSHK